MNEILRQLADNPNLFEAVKEHILAEFKLPLDIIPQDDDRLLGQRYRAMVAGAALVEKAFKDIKRLETPKQSPPRRMEGR